MNTNETQQFPGGTLDDNSEVLLRIGNIKTENLIQHYSLAIVGIMTYGICVVALVIVTLFGLFLGALTFPHWAILTVGLIGLIVYVVYGFSVVRALGDSLLGSILRAAGDTVLLPVMTIGIAFGETPTVFLMKRADKRAKEIGDELGFDTSSWDVKKPLIEQFQQACVKYMLLTGVCPECRYEINDLLTCPECGFERELVTAP